MSIYEIVAILVVLLIVCAIAYNAGPKKKKRIEAAEAQRQKQAQEKERQEKERRWREETEAAERTRQREKAIEKARARLAGKKPDQEFVFQQQIGKCQAAYSYKDVLIDPAPDLDYNKISLGYPLDLRQNGDQVHVYQEDGLLLGDMRDNKLRRMVHDWARQGEPVVAIANAWDDEKPMVQIATVFYSNLLAMAERRGLKEYKLTSNKGKDAQEEIEFLEEGQLCDLEYDIDKEKYEVIPAGSGQNIGYVSAKDITEESRFVVSEIAENDNDKYDVWGYIV